MTEQINPNHDVPENTIKVSINDVSENIDDILTHRLPVYRLNEHSEYVIIPLDKIKQFIGEAEKDLELYIASDWQEKVEKKEMDLSVSGAENADNENVSQPKDKEEQSNLDEFRRSIEKYSNISEQVNVFKQMSVVEREEVLDKCIEDLHEINNQSHRLDLRVIVKLVEIIANTFYANYINMEDNQSTVNVKNSSFGIFTKTEWMLKLLIEYFQSPYVKFEDYKHINSIKTGSSTVDSMCRSLLWFIGYCLFFNRYIDSGLITKNIRGDFKTKYLRYYKRRLPDLNVRLETVIKGGMRRIETQRELLLYSIGSLLYDIGKIPNVDYHDGDKVFDENMLKLHTLLGYNMLLRTKKYPFEVIAMAAFHHEYYGGRGSYNFTNPVLSKLLKRKRTDANVFNFITYEARDFIEGYALAYFPCKMIEIIDIYNALVGKREMSHFDAFFTMKKEFVALSLKIDPLLFEIFTEFICRCGLLTDNERQKVDAIIF